MVENIIHLSALIVIGTIVVGLAGFAIGWWTALLIFLIWTVFVVRATDPKPKHDGEV